MLLKGVVMQRNRVARTKREYRWLHRLSRLFGDDTGQARRVFAGTGALVRREGAREKGPRCEVS